jgi:hypothetical protein
MKIAKILSENDADLVNDTTYTDGMVGAAFDFTGNGSAVAPTNELPIGDSDRTLALWVKVDTFQDGESFFVGYGRIRSFTQTYNLGTVGRNLFFSQWGDALFGPELQAGRWYHLAVTNVGSAVTLYLDGEAVASGNFKINTPGDTQLYIGRLEEDNAKRLDGQVDEIGIYNRALSASEIKALFLAGSDGLCR